MKVGIMQPYFFPYIGYFQLIDSVDLFVLHDDVQFIKSGWIHRNRYLREGQPAWFGLSLGKSSSAALINEKKIVSDFDYLALFRKLHESYKAAQNYQKIIEDVRQAIEIGSDSLVDVNQSGLRLCCNYFDIKTPIINSSSLKLPENLKGEARVIEIVKRCQGDIYINPIGGLDLYHDEEFEKNNIELLFHSVAAYSYTQPVPEFVPHLSIIDVIMRATQEEQDALLQCKQVQRKYFYKEINSNHINNVQK